MNNSRPSLADHAKTIRFLGLALHCVSYQDMFELFDEWTRTRTRRGRSVALINVNCCVSGLLDRNVRKLYQQADLLGIDSMPFLRIARVLRNKSSDRLYAPDMMIEAAKESRRRGYKFFFYGGAQGAAEAMADFLHEKQPDLEIAGTLSPPFRQLSAKEDDAVCQTILDSGANLVWVGLGSPKQDVWIAEHCDKLPGCVLIASGATFDFFSGRVKQAPRLIRNLGFEWLFRLFQDPVRLWKRYTIYNFLFLCAVLLEVAGLLRLGDEHSQREELA